MLITSTHSRSRRCLPAVCLLIMFGFFVCCPLTAAAGDAGPQADGAKGSAGADGSDPVTGTVESGPDLRTAPARTVVAKVGETEITEADLEDAVFQKVRSIYSHGQDLSRLPKYRREALDELIDTELFYREAVKRGITVDEDTVNTVVRKNIERLGSEKAFQRVLQERGLSAEDFRQGVRKRRLVIELLSKLFQESAYADDELLKYYEENRESFRRPDSVHLYSILLKVDPSAPDEEWQKKKEKAEELLKRIRSGEKFYDIAYNNSEDPYRVKGGDLGFIHKGLLTPAELETAAFSLKPDEVSDVIRTIQGFHILKAGERKPGELLAFEKVKEELAGKLRNKRFEEKKAEILRRMREEFPVRIMITFEDKEP